MKRLSINISPHAVSPLDTRSLMKGVILALVPAMAASLFFFRMKALMIIVVSVTGCVLTEFVLQKARKREVTTGDLSAVLTGILLALVLPPAIPLWMVFLGGIFAISMGKEVFGGLGNNIFNPALLSRAFLMAAFPVALTTWSEPVTLEAVTTATPLGLAKFGNIITSYGDLFIGNVSGCIGETSSLALLAGFGYMLYKKIVDYRIPVSFAITVTVFSGIMYLVSDGKYAAPIFQLLAGGFLLGALFMATDPVTSPVTVKGRWVFGAGCGLVTLIIRYWGGLPEGVMYSILLMNAITPLLNKMTRPRRYGVSDVR